MIQLNDGEASRESRGPVPLEDKEKQFQEFKRFFPVMAGLVYALLFLIDGLIARMPGLGTSLVLVAFFYIGVMYKRKAVQHDVGEIVHSLPRVYINFNYNNGYEQCFSMDGWGIEDIPMEAIYIQSCYGIIQAQRIPHDGTAAAIIERESAAGEYPRKMPIDQLKNIVTELQTLGMDNCIAYHVKVDHMGFFKHMTGRGNQVIAWHEAIWIMDKEWHESIRYRPRIVFGAGFHYMHEQVESIELDYTGHKILSNVPIFRLTGCSAIRTDRTKPIEITRDQLMAMVVDSFSHFYVKADARNLTIEDKLMHSYGVIDSIRGANLSKRVDDAIMQDEAEESADNERYALRAPYGRAESNSRLILGIMFVVIVLVLVLVLVK